MLLIYAGFRTFYFPEFAFKKITQKTKIVYIFFPKDNTKD